MAPQSDSGARTAPRLALRPIRFDSRARARVERFLVEPRNVAWVLVALSVVAALQQVLLGSKPMGGGIYTHVNNFRIYQRSFLHLVRGLDPYLPYPAEHWDIFKYSPTFAVLMAPFAPLPDAVGVVLWNAINAAVFVCWHSRSSRSFRTGARRSSGSSSCPSSSPPSRTRRRTCSWRGW